MAARIGIGRRIGIGILSGYQRWVSPLMAPRCRFSPSCSEYARQAIEKHGLLGGSARSLWRLVRCHPFHPGGYDPVR